MKKLFMIAAVAGSLFAQQQADTDRIAADVEKVQSQLRTAQQTVEFVSSMSVGPTTKGAPYSAEAVNESIQKLYDGNRIVEKSSTKVYRDSEGRERREEGAPMNVVFITDPVAKMNYTLNPDAKTASKTSGGGTFFFQSSVAAAGAVRGTVSAAPIAVAGASGIGRGRGGNVNVVTNNTPYLATTRIVNGTPGLQLSIGPAPGEGKVEDLGTQMIEGVQAKGTRATTTIPVGQIGNDREIEVVDERWYSPELQLTVMTRHSDPRSGETTYKLTNIQRIEQVRSLFEIPTNYTIATEDVLGPRIFRMAEPATPAKKEE